MCSFWMPSGWNTSNNKQLKLLLIGIIGYGLWHDEQKYAKMRVDEGTIQYLHFSHIGKWMKWRIMIDWDMMVWSPERGSIGYMVHSYVEQLLPQLCCLREDFMRLWTFGRLATTRYNWMRKGSQNSPKYSACLIPRTCFSLLFFRTRSSILEILGAYNSINKIATYHSCDQLKNESTHTFWYICWKATPLILRSPISASANKPPSKCFGTPMLLASSILGPIVKKQPLMHWVRNKHTSHCLKYQTRTDIILTVFLVPGFSGWSFRVSKINLAWHLPQFQNSSLQGCSFS